MSQNEFPDIDELLNGFIDGELDQRHQTEVQRLIKHDKRITERLQKLQNCKRLVSSLPYIEAPQELLGNIKAALEQSKLPVQPIPDRQYHREREGARHLLFRRLTAAAAMIGLVAVLAVVIYTIVAPEVTIDKPVAVVQPKESEPAAVVAAAEKAVKPVSAKREFSGRLELKTSTSSEVVAFINKAIESDIPADQRSTAVPGRPRESFTLTCSRQNLGLLLADLGTIWDRIDSATLFVDTDQPERQIVIDAVAPEQIIEIAKQDDFQMQQKAAKYFAALNNIEQTLPGKEVLTAVDEEGPQLITIPKPVLTSGESHPQAESEKPVTKAATGAEAEKKVSLTIVVTGIE